MAESNTPKRPSHTTKQKPKAEQPTEETVVDEESKFPNYGRDHELEANRQSELQRERDEHNARRTATSSAEAAAENK